MIEKSGRYVSRQVTYTGRTATYRTVGNAATSQIIATIENAAGSVVLVAPQSIECYCDLTAALTAVTPTLRLTRASGVSGGTVLTKSGADGLQTSASQTVVRGATASDGGVLTPITATIGSITAAALLPRMHTLVGQVLMQPIALSREAESIEPLLLRSGEAIAVQIVAAAATSNPATNSYLVNVTWEEYQ